MVRVGQAPSRRFVNYKAMLSGNSPPILLGTSSFTASGCEGVFYPKGMRPADYLAFYAEHFHTLEVDSTFNGLLFGP